MAYSVALVSASGSGSDSLVNYLYQALLEYGHDVTEVLDANIGSTSFASFDLAIIWRSAASASQIESTIAKPCIIGNYNTSQGTGVSWPGSNLGIATTIEVGQNETLQNGIVVSDNSHDITLPYSESPTSYTIGYAVGTGSYPAAIEGASQGTDYVGTMILEGVTGGYFAGLPLGIAVPAGTAKLTSGNTSYRYVALTSVGVPYSNVYTKFYRNIIERSLAWLMGDIGAIDTGMTDGSPAGNETFDGETDNVAPSGWSYYNGSNILRCFADNEAYDLFNLAPYSSGTGGQLFDGGASETDKDIILRYRHGNVNATSFRIYAKGGAVSLRIQSDNSSQRYWVIFYDETGASQIGSSQYFYPATWNSANRHWLWVRFQVYDDGSLVYFKYKMWQGFHRDEPGSWDYETTDATRYGVSGKSGVSIQQSGTTLYSNTILDQFLESGTLATSTTKTVSLDGAIQKQGNTLSVGLDAKIQNPEARVTQLGKLVTGYGEDILKVTQLGKQILWKDELPTKPSILSAVSADGRSVVITSSSYYSAEGQPHESTRYQIQALGGVWGTLVYDSGELGAVEGVTTGSVLNPETAYQVRVAYKDDEGDWSDWSNAYGFWTPVEGTGTGYTGDFDWADWAQLWNIGSSRYYSTDRPNGGWVGPMAWSHGEPRRDGECTNDSGTAGATPDAKYTGNVANLGRLMGPPSALVNTTLGANNGVNVAARLNWYSSYEGFTWEHLYDSEFARAGVAAMVCGKSWPKNPYYAWGIWGTVVTPGGDWEFTDEYQGVVAFIEPQFGWPYWPCPCGTSTCYYIGYLGAKLVVSAYFDGYGQVVARYDLPWQIVPNAMFERCANEPGSQPTWACYFYPWYGIRLKVWHDYAADPTGKTHRIQVAATTPPTTTYPAPNAGTRGTGEADLPGVDGPWMIDTTWVGGNEESTPGAGDGGLKPGWCGYASDRHTGAVPTRTSGLNVFRDFTATVLDTSFSETPCDATPLSEEAPPEDDPPVDPGETGVAAVATCPPDQDTADKEVFLGGSFGGRGGIFRFGGYEVQAGNQIRARIRPNAIAPMGYGGECIFHKIVVIAEHFSDLHISIVPILNGERLDAYAQEEIFVGPGDRQVLRRYEVPLYRAFEDAVVEGGTDRFKYGLRGTYFSFEMTVVDLCGIGLQLPGVWVECEPIRESHNTGVVYTEDLQIIPAFIPNTQVFMGEKGGNRILRAESGTTDGGVEVQARVVSNPVAPAGAGGECEFRRFSLVVTRWNGNAMDMVVTPHIDGVAIGPITITYQPTTAPVTEVTEIDLTTHYARDGADAVERFRYRKRGAWFHLKVETGSGLQEWLTLEGGELEYDVVRESLQKDVR